MSATIGVKNTSAVTNRLRNYGKGVESKGQQAIVRAAEQAYQMAQSLCAVKSGETKRKMRPPQITPNRFETGFYRADFAAPVPWFLEFGTKKMGSHPCIIPTRKAVLPRLRAELEQAVKVHG